MSPIRSVLNWLTSPLRTAIALNAAPGIMPPSRATNSNRVTPERALTLSTVYRGIQIHATAGCQLSLSAERNGAIIDTPALLTRPDLAQSRSAFLEYTIVSLYIDGNAFWLKTRAPENSRRPGEVINLTPLNPNEVAVKVTRRAAGDDTVTFAYRGRDYTQNEISHLQLLRVPGMHRGLGPIQAAQIELSGALDARDYGALWLSDSNMPDGTLTTDQVLGQGDAEKYKNVWYGRNADGTPKDTPAAALNERLRVLGQGLKYEPLLLKPSDVQFLETQQFTTTQIARLLGNPASLLLAAVEGNSQTYQNVEQDWIGYVRFALMKPLREMEEALSEILPGQQTARFKLDVLLRTDTKTRYEGHAIALTNGWMTPDEVREIEGLAPLTPAQTETIATRAPAKEITK